VQMLAALVVPSSHIRVPPRICVGKGGGTVVGPPTRGYVAVGEWVVLLHQPNNK
jgi:hypothetical protein